MDVRELVAGSFLDGAPIVPVSAKTGEGLDALRAALAAVSRQARGRAAGGVARLPIDRVFSMKGFGTVVTGTLVSGRIAVDDELAMAPGDRRVKVRGVQVHGAEAAGGGRRAAHGDQPGRRRGRRDRARPGAGDARRVRGDAARRRDDRAAARREAVEARRARALSSGHRRDPGTRRDHRPAAMGRRQRPAVVRAVSRSARHRAGRRAFVRLRLEAPAVLARGDRYILRAYSPPVTIAGGLILDPRPPRTAIRTAAALARCRAARLRARRRRSRRGRAARACGDDRRRRRAGLSLAAMTSRAGVDPGQVDAQADALVAAKQAVRAGDVLVAVADLRAAERRDRRDADRASQEAAACRRGSRAKNCASSCSRAATRRCSIARWRIWRRPARIFVKDRVALATHRVELTPEEERARAAIDRAYRDGGLTPPDAAAVAAAAGAPAPVVDRC